MQKFKKELQFEFVFVEAAVESLVIQVLEARCFGNMSLYNPKHMTDLKDSMQ